MGTYKVYNQYGTRIHTYEFNPKQERFAYEYGIDMKLEPIDKLPRPNTDEDVACVTNWNYFDWSGKNNNGYGEIEQNGIQKRIVSIDFPSISFHNGLLTFGDIPKADIGAGVGQVIVLDGKKNLINPAKLTTYKDARTAIGQLNDGNVVLAVCVGDDTKKLGLSSNEFAEFFLTLKARVAFIGDGGGSSSMMVDGKYVYNQGRAIACGFVVYKKKESIKNGNFLVVNCEEFEEWLSKQNVKRKITTLEMHHTWKPSYLDFTKKPDEMYWIKVLDRWARVERGWKNGNPAQFLTFPSGKIGIARSLELEGGGVAFNSDTNVTVENLGNFDTEIMTQEQMNAIVFLTKALVKKFNISLDSNGIVYHSWFNLKTGVKDNLDGKKPFDGVNYKTCPSYLFFGGNTYKAMQENLFPLLKDIESEDIMVEKSYIQKKQIMVNESLNVRSEPNTEKAPVGSLKKDEVVIITGEIGDWYRISFNDKDAYIHKSYTKDFKEINYQELYNKSNDEVKELNNKISKAINILN